MLAMNARPGDHPAHQQDRPARRGARAREGTRSRMAWPSPPTTRCSPRARPARASTIFWKPWSTIFPRSGGRRGRAPLRALIFDSYFDAYRGVVALVRVVDGAHRPKGDKIRMMATGTETLVEEVGARHAPAEVPEEALCAGEVGYLVTGAQGREPGEGGRHHHRGRRRRERAAARLPRGEAHGVHRSLSHRRRPVRALEGGAGEAVTERPGARAGSRRPPHALGFGFRVRLSGASAHGGHQGAAGARVRPGPSGHGALAWSTTCTSRAARWCRSTRPRRCPTPAPSITWKSPIVKAKILIPPDYVGAVMDLAVDRRGTFVTMNYLSPDHRRDALGDAPCPSSSWTSSTS